MKKIKNVLLVLLMLVVANTMGFAAVEKQFEVNTSIPGVLELKVSTYETVALSAWSGLTDLTAVSLTHKDAIQLYLHIRNNQRSTITVKATIPHMAAVDTTYVIPYTLNGLASTMVATEQTVATITYANNGMRIDTVGFSINPDDNAFENAAAGSYKSMITFNVTAP